MPAKRHGIRLLPNDVASDGPAILVEIAAARGSVPRDAGAWMLVSAGEVAGTIGGGQLEYLAIDHARRMLRQAEAASDLNVPLGPEIGQCCGGRVSVKFRSLDAALGAELGARLAHARELRPEILVFGAGHVGRALCAALALLPVRGILIDSRADEIRRAPDGVETRLTPLPESLVDLAPPGSAFVVLTHDHALDFLITDAALARGDAAYVGLIGSATKRARFAKWRAEHGACGGTDGLTCPIGGPSGDKRPEIIAAFTAAEIMANLGDRPGRRDSEVGTRDTRSDAAH
jgi:xanthine dehydrogenase accessory factor